MVRIDRKDTTTFPFNIIIPRNKEGTIWEDGPFDQDREQRERDRQREFYRREESNRERIMTTPMIPLLKTTRMLDQ